MRKKKLSSEKSDLEPRCIIQQHIASCYHSFFSFNSWRKILIRAIRRFILGVQGDLAFDVASRHVDHADMIPTLASLTVN